MLSPPVDERALADVTRDVEAQRAHVAAMCSAGGTATMSGEHARRIQSAGSSSTVASHGPQMANGGKAGLGERGIDKKPHQMAAQAALAEKKRAYRAAARPRKSAHTGRRPDARRVPIKSGEVTGASTGQVQAHAQRHRRTITGCRHGHSTRAPFRR